MGAIIITFGQGHTHRVNGKTFDCDCVARIPCRTFIEGREKAFDLFGDKWCFCYNELKFGEKINYFPRGIIDI